MATVKRRGLGPRPFVLIRRVHEWQGGALVLAATGALARGGPGASAFTVRRFPTPEPPAPAVVAS